jgi:hypothetical protein
VQADACVPDNGCPLSCSGHGACVAKVCGCDLGYQGDGCETCATGWHHGADGVTCTRSHCDPSPCTGGMLCSEQAGCCPATCTPDATECSNGMQRRCDTQAGGCWDWTAAASCGAGGCQDATQCKPIATGVTIDEWGSSADDFVESVAFGSSGEVIAAGFSSASLGGQAYIGASDVTVGSRKAPAGANWTRQRGTTGVDIAYGVVRVSSGDVYATGVSAGSLETGLITRTAPFLAKWSSSGELRWSKSWGSTAADEGHALALDDKGNLYVAGVTTGDLAATNAGDYDGFVSKLDASGNVLWSAQWGTTAEDWATAVAVDSGGNVYTTGRTSEMLPGQSTAYAGMWDAFLIKHSPTGKLLWTRQWGSTESDQGSGLAIGADDSVYVVGVAGDLGRSGAGGAFLGKWDSAGNEKWIEQWGDAGTSLGERVALDASGAIYVAGETTATLDGATNAGGADAFVSKWTDKNGTRTREWSKQFGTTSKEYAYAIAVATDGTIALAGSTRGSLPGFTNQGSYDNFLIRIVP